MMAINKKYVIIYILLSLFLPPLLASAEEQAVPSYVSGEYYEDNILLTSEKMIKENSSYLNLSRKMLDFRLGVIEEHDDNIRLASKDKISDTSTVIEPALKLSWPHKTFSLSLNYSSSLLFYHNHPGDDRYSHVGEGAAEFYLPAKTSFNLWVQDVYSLFPRNIQLPPTRENAVEGNELGVKPSLKFERFSPIYLEAGYLYQRQDYRKQKEGVEWKGEGPNLALGREFVSKWDIALLYQHLDKDYTPNAEFISTATNYKDDLAGLRLKYNPSDRLNGEIIYNRLWRDFASGDKTQKNIWEGNITFALTSNVSIKADYLQSFLDDADGNLYEHTIAEFGIDQHLGKRIGLHYGLYAYKDSYERIGKTDEAWGTNDSISIAILQRLSLILQGDYERRSFRNIDDSSDIEDYYTAGAELDYTIKDKFSAFIRYLRLENIARSNVSVAGDYASNRYAVGIRFVY